MSKQRDEDVLANFLPVSRKFFNHPFWREERQFSKSEAWLDLIRSARFEESQGQALIGGRMVKWSRGQLPASLRFLAERWAWSKNKVDDFLRMLEKEGMVTRTIIEGQTIITLCNYETYNQKGQSRGQKKGQPNTLQTRVSAETRDNQRDSWQDAPGTAEGQPGDETKKGNNGKKNVSVAVAPDHTPEDVEMFHLFEMWIAKNAANVSRMKEPFTLAEFLKLRGKLRKEQVQDILLKMHNWKPLLQKNNSAYLTLINWSRKEYNSTAPGSGENATNINEKLKAAGKEAGDHPG